MRHTQSPNQTKLKHMYYFNMHYQPLKLRQNGENPFCPVGICTNSCQCYATVSLSTAGRRTSLRSPFHHWSLQYNQQQQGRVWTVVKHWSRRSACTAGLAGRTQWPLLATFFSPPLSSLISLLCLLFSQNGLSLGSEICHWLLSHKNIRFCVQCCKIEMYC